MGAPRERLKTRVGLPRNSKGTPHFFIGKPDFLILFFDTRAHECPRLALHQEQARPHVPTALHHDASPRAICDLATPAYNPRVEPCLPRPSRPHRAYSNRGTWTLRLRGSARPYRAILGFHRLLRSKAQTAYRRIARTRSHCTSAEGVCPGSRRHRPQRRGEGVL